MRSEFEYLLDTEEDLYVDIIQFNSGADAHLKVLIYNPFEESETECWDIKINCCIVSSIIQDRVPYAETFFSKNHPLLLEAIEPRVNLYYKGQVNNPAKLLEDLYSFDRDMFYPRLSVNHGHARVITNKEVGSMDGPRYRMKGYSEILQRHNLEVSMKERETPAFYDNGKTITGENFEILIMNKSYFIGKEFQVKKVDSNDELSRK
jgi:hypothetical protein